MKRLKLMAFLIGAALVVCLAGCGSGNRESSSSASLMASQACISCHTSKLSPVTQNSIVTEWQNSAHNFKNGASCPDCHKPQGHPSGGTITKSPLDGVCLECHTTTKLASPHFANFTTSLASQYVSQSDVADVQCRKCHNPHDTTSLIQYNKDWAKSGHGDTTFSNDANANNDSVNSHYPWTTAARDACAKCHTTTGYVKFSTIGSGITVLNGVVSGGPIMSNNKKNETIMCSACHNDYSWTRRSIGPQTLEYQYNVTNIVLPDSGDSNLCLVCHSGRGNFQSARSTRFEGHHLATGADLFAEFSHVGFEFTGLSYAKQSFFQHDKIGLADGSGPCVSCHMKATNNHTFEPVVKDANGVITTIKAQAVCNTCHTGGFAITPAILEEESLGYQNAGKLLKDYLANSITNYKNLAVNPTTTAQANALPEGDYGSYQNAFLPTEDPGGYVHNSFYVKRLIFDSIDWLDNGAFNGSITINATNYPQAAVWFGATSGATGDFIASRPQ